MTDAHAPQTLPPEEPKAEGATAPEKPEAPAPEPWTAAKVLEWNAYYDLYIALAFLLLAFLGSLNQLTQSSVWAHLRAGQALTTHFGPTADPFSFSEPGRTWVHVPWLSDLVNYQVYSLVANFAPADDAAPAKPAPAPGAEGEAVTPGDPRGEQWGASGLIVLNALIRLLAMLALFSIRHKGPGLWWATLCAALALAVLPTPIGIVIGGLGGPAGVGSEVWGELFVAIELLLIFRGFSRRSVGALYALVPLFLVWANVDESFLFGLLVLAGVTAGLALKRRDPKAATGPAGGPTVKTALIVLLASAAICLVNPSIHRIYPAALGSILPIPGWSPGPLMASEVSIFGASFRAEKAEVDLGRIFYFILVGIGLASFALNRRRFSPPRLLAFAVAAVLWALVQRYATEFAEVLAVVLILNGQEWYQDRFGTEGHLGRGWAFWSTGGRAVTLCLGFAVVLKTIFGWGSVPGEPQFGLGFNPGNFAFEAAETIRDSPIKGNVLNTAAPEGDAILWRAYPARKSFIDSRRHLFSPTVIEKFDAIRKALRDDNIDAWKPLLDEFGASAVMIDVALARNTYPTLLASRDWIRFYDDGKHVLFGRADAKAEDLAYFRKREMNPDNLAYSNPEPPPSSEQLPTGTSDLAKLYPKHVQAQPHTMAAARWLRPADVAPNTPYLADPARCFLAIRDARKALHTNVNESAAYLQLADAYNILLSEESALLAGIEPTQANVAAIGQVTPQVVALQGRYRQYITALHYAVLTTPPPQDEEARRELARLNLRLYQAYYNQGSLDLARDRLEEWSKLASTADYPPEQYTALSRQLSNLNNHLTEVQRAVTNLGIETQAGPVQKADLARQNGAVGLAIQQYEEALQNGMNPALIKPRLLDLYCQVGEPDKAGELWQAGSSADRTLSDPNQPGTAALRQGRVYLLLGNYESALAIWNREAIPSLRMERSLGGPMAVRYLLEGDPATSARTLLQIPEEGNKQALWEFEAGMASLEAGHPVDETAAHLTNALTLVPNLALRPVIAYYLKKLGRPVPEPPADAKKPEKAPLPLPSIAPVANPAPGATIPAPGTPK